LFLFVFERRGAYALQPKKQSTTREKQTRDYRILSPDAAKITSGDNFLFPDVAMKFSRKFATAVWEGYFMGSFPAIRAVKKQQKPMKTNLKTNKNSGCENKKPVFPLSVLAFLRKNAIFAKTNQSNIEKY